MLSDILVYLILIHPKNASAPETCHYMDTPTVFLSIQLYKVFATFVVAFRSIASHLKDVHHLDESTLNRVLEELGPEDVVVPPEKPKNTPSSDGTAVRKRKQAVRAENLDNNRPYVCGICDARFNVKR